MDVSVELVAEMSAPDAGLRRVPMSWDDFLRLPREVFAEWVDGEAVVSPRPSWEHGAAVIELAVRLRAALPGLSLATEAGVWLPGGRLRGPDLVAVGHAPETAFLEEAPVLAVEVLSPSTRSEDTVTKSAEYAAAGVGQFWVVDPERRTIDVYTNADGGWDPVLHLDDGHLTGEVVVGEHGVVPLDLTAILPH